MKKAIRLFSILFILSLGLFITACSCNEKDDDKKEPVVISCEEDPTQEKCKEPEDQRMAALKAALNYKETGAKVRVVTGREQKFEINVSYDESGNMSFLALWTTEREKSIYAVINSYVSLVMIQQDNSEYEYKFTSPENIMDDAGIFFIKDQILDKVGIDSFSYDEASDYYISTSSGNKVCIKVEEGHVVEVTIYDKDGDLEGSVFFSDFTSTYVRLPNYENFLNTLTESGYEQLVDDYLDSLKECSSFTFNLVASQNGSPVMKMGMMIDFLNDEYYFDDAGNKYYIIKNAGLTAKLYEDESQYQLLYVDEDKLEDQFDKLEDVLDILYEFDFEDALVKSFDYKTKSAVIEYTDTSYNDVNADSVTLVFENGKLTSMEIITSSDNDEYIKDHHILVEFSDYDSTVIELPDFDYANYSFDSDLIYYLQDSLDNMNNDCTASFTINGEAVVETSSYMFRLYEEDTYIYYMTEADGDHLKEEYGLYSVDDDKLIVCKYYDGEYLGKTVHNSPDAVAFYTYLLQITSSAYINTCNYNSGDGSFVLSLETMECIITFDEGRVSSVTIDYTKGGEQSIYFIDITYTNQTFGIKQEAASDLFE